MSNVRELIELLGVELDPQLVELQEQYLEAKDLRAVLAERHAALVYLRSFQREIKDLKGLKYTLIDLDEVYVSRLEIGKQIDYLWKKMKQFEYWYMLDV